VHERLDVAHFGEPSAATERPTSVAWAILGRFLWHTAYRWFHDGVLPVPAERVGPRTILVNPHGTKLEPPAGVSLYARVSSHDQKNDLDRL
jgi:putative resolvase